MLTQALMDRLAREDLRLNTGRLAIITVQHRVNRSDTPVVYDGLDAQFVAFRESVLAAQALVPDEQRRVIRGDQQVKIATAFVVWAPSLHDVIVDEDTVAWNVQDIAGGRGRPFWYYHVRQQPMVS